MVADVPNLRSITDVPVCVGFGIKDAATAAVVAQHADGVVVGSALVQLMAQSSSVDDAVARLRGLRRPFGKALMPEQIRRKRSGCVADLHRPAACGLHRDGA